VIEKALFSLITHHSSLFEKEKREMADQDKSENESGGQGGTPKQSKTGDPGRTPGKAEGDEETADEALGDDDNKPLH
jgi:hypothetical protein